MYVCMYEGIYTHTHTHTQTHTQRHTHTHTHTHTHITHPSARCNFVRGMGSPTKNITVSASSSISKTKKSSQK